MILIKKYCILHLSVVGSPSCPLSSPAQATLEKLLFSQPLSTGDYHYSGKPLTLTFNLIKDDITMWILVSFHLAASSLRELQWHCIIHLARANSRSCLEAHPLLSCRALHVSLLRLVLLGCRAGPMTCWYLHSLFFLASLPIALLFVSLGSDFWTEGERSLFSAALEMHGKEFSLIQKMVRRSLSFMFVYARSSCVKLLYVVKGTFFFSNV